MGPSQSTPSPIVPQRPPPPGLPEPKTETASQATTPPPPPPSLTRLPHSALMTSTPEVPPSTSRFSHLVSDLGAALEKMSEEQRALMEFESMIMLMNEEGKEGGQIWDDKPKPQRGA